jgi:hypothetical protein
MPKQEVLEMCEKAIRKNLGDLDDLPYELANTVANVYYKYFDHAVDVMKRAANNPGRIPKEMKRETDMLEGLTSFVENTAIFESDFEAVPNFIEGLREIDKHEQPNLYQYTVDFILDCLKYDITVDFILDCLKYDIKDAHKKTGLRRMIERKIKKRKVQEIPNLIGLLDV